MKFVNSDFGRSKLSPEESVQYTSLASTISSFTKNQNSFAVASFIFLYEDLPGHDSVKNEVYPGYDGLTVQQ